MAEKVEVLKKIMTDKFPVLMRNTSPQFQQAQWIQNRMKEKKLSFCRKTEQWRQIEDPKNRKIDYLQSNEHLTHSLFFNSIYRSQKTMEW